MQHALILNRLIPEQEVDGRICAINAVTHDGRSVRFESDAQQRINLTALEFQQTPLLVLVDQLLEPFSGMLTVPSQALLAIVPIEAERIKAMLSAGQGDELLSAARDQMV